MRDLYPEITKKVVFRRERYLTRGSLLTEGKENDFLTHPAKFICIFRPLCNVFLPYCQGRPKKRWHTSMSRTSHTIWSWYRFPLDKGTVHISLTVVSPFFVIQFTLYGFGCGSPVRLRVETSFLETVLVLPLSMITWHTFPFIVHQVQKRACCWGWLSALGVINTCWRTHESWSPSSGWI